MASAGFGCVAFAPGIAPPMPAAHPNCDFSMPAARPADIWNEFWVGSGALNLKRDGSLALAILVGTATEFS